MEQPSYSGGNTRTGITAPFNQNLTTPGTGYNLDHLGLKYKGFYVLGLPDDDMYCYYESPSRHLLDEPRQASCGHRLCKSCIVTLSLTNTEGSCNAPDCNTKNRTKDVCKTGETPTPDIQDLERRIGRLLTTCPKVNCAWRGPTGSISEHNIQGQHYPLSIIDDSINFLYLTKLMISNIEEKSFLKTETQKQALRISSLKTETQKQALRISSLETKTQEQQQSNLNLKTEVQELKKEICEISTAFSKLLNQVQTDTTKKKPTYYKKFEMIIHSVKERRGEAIDKCSCYTTSPPFYTHSNGYKLEIGVYLDGNRLAVQDQYISIYIVILKGEFDSTLTWPLPVTKIWFTLINKNNASKNITKSLHVTRRSKCYQKPVSIRNAGFGMERFVELSKIDCDQGFTKDDTMVIEVTIENTQA